MHFVGTGVFRGRWALERLRSLGLAVSVGNINALNQPLLDCNVPPKSEPLQGRIYTGKTELHFAFPRTGKHLPRPSHSFLFDSVRAISPLARRVKELGMCQVILG